jgi:hypothetical protein
MGRFVERGGYVVTTPDQKFVYNVQVDQQKLQQIAALLGIKPDDIDKMRTISTIYIDASGKK